MTNEVKLFNNEMFGEIQVVTFKDQPMFVAKEIAMILGYSATGAMNKIIDEDDKFKHTIQNGTNYVNQSLITESGLYQAIFGSTKPEAKQFKKWVTSEILPALRKTGAYIVGEENMTEDQMIFAGYTALMRKCTGLEAQVNALQFTTSSLEQKVTSLEPKGDFYDAVNHAVNAIDFKTFAGMLISQATKKPYGRNTLMKDLRNHGILNYKNQPYQQYAHYFDVITATKNNQLVTTTYVKPNGVTFISGKLKSIGLAA